MQVDSFDTCITCVYLDNTDHGKYGSLFSNFKVQFLLGNDQYPKKLSGTNDMLVNHIWGRTYNKSKMKAKNNKNNNSSNGNEEKKSETEGKNFNQQRRKLSVIAVEKKVTSWMTVRSVTKFLKKNGQLKRV